LAISGTLKLDWAVFSFTEEGLAGCQFSDVCRVLFSVIPIYCYKLMLKDYNN
jgi:uncharacterized membrane protein